LGSQILRGVFFLKILLAKICANKTFFAHLSKTFALHGARLAVSPDLQGDNSPAVIGGRSLDSGGDGMDALAAGVKVTGCTVMIVDEGVDTGPILAQRAVEVREDDTEASLHERIKTAERDLVVGTIGTMLRSGWTIEGRIARVGTMEGTVT
jgi:hypothetical protein